jgi:hypothetical protein
VAAVRSRRRRRGAPLPAMEVEVSGEVC